MYTYQYHRLAYTKRLDLIRFFLISLGEEYNLIE